AFGLAINAPTNPALFLSEDLQFSLSQRERAGPLARSSRRLGEVRENLPLRQPCSRFERHSAPDTASGHGRYVFSVVRPSPGAATSVRTRISEKFRRLSPAQRCCS